VEKVFSKRFFLKKKNTAHSTYKHQSFIFQNLVRMGNGKIRVHQQFPENQTSGCQPHTSKHFSPTPLHFYFTSSLEEKWPLFSPFLCSQLAFPPSLKRTGTRGRQLQLQTHSLLNVFWEVKIVPIIPSINIATEVTEVN